jgi:hypothetical protein
MNGYDGWLSIEHEDVMVSHQEGVRKSVELPKVVAPSEAADFQPQEFQVSPERLVERRPAKPDRKIVAIATYQAARASDSIDARRRRLIGPFREGWR